MGVHWHFDVESRPTHVAHRQLPHAVLGRSHLLIGGGVQTTEYVHVVGDEKRRVEFALLRECYILHRNMRISIQFLHFHSIISFILEHATYNQAIHRNSSPQTATSSWPGQTQAAISTFGWNINISDLN